MKPLRSRGSPIKEGRNKNRLPCRGRKNAWNRYITLHSRGSPAPSAGRKSELATSSLPSRGPKEAEMLCHPCFLRGSQRQARGENQNWLTHDCLHGGPQVGRNAMSPLHSRGPQSKGKKIRKGYFIPALPRAQKRAGWLRNSSVLGGPQPKGDKIRIGCLISGFSGAQKCARLLCNSAFSGVPNAKSGENIRSGNLTPAFSGPKRGRHCYVTPFGGSPIKGEENQKWLPNPCLLMGPKEGVHAT